MEPTTINALRALQKKVRELAAGAVLVHTYPPDLLRCVSMLPRDVTEFCFTDFTPAPRWKFSDVRAKLRRWDSSGFAHVRVKLPSCSGYTRLSEAPESELDCALHSGLLRVVVYVDVAKLAVRSRSILFTRPP